MTQEQITNINKICPYDQGIFVEPNWIPVHIKEPVIYMRWSSGGVSGGSYLDSSNPQPYYNEDEPPAFEVLDLVLKELKPNIQYLQYKELEKLTHTNSETEHEYYGNCTDWKVKYIVLSDLEVLLTKL